MRLEVSYIMYATSSHEQTGNIITFSQFQEGRLLKNECNLVEYWSISDSIDESYAEDKSNDWSIIKNSLGEIRDKKMCIRILTQEIPDLKYVTKLGICKVCAKEQNSQQKVWRKVYTSSSMFL